ncbi:MAG: tetratricopeptide repeat protein [Ignavibacteria bacterium]|nr:tetratricopeptide repeat protein [Ignavibacteria bacterium]
MATNKYEKAESLFLEVLRIRKDVLGEENLLSYAISLNNFAEFCSTIGKYKKPSHFL